MWQAVAHLHQQLYVGRVGRLLDAVRVEQRHDVAMLWGEQVAVLRFRRMLEPLRKEHQRGLLHRRRWDVLNLRNRVRARRSLLALVACLCGVVACGGKTGSIATNEIPGGDSGGGIAGADAAGAGFPGSGGAGGAAGTAGTGGTAGQGGVAGTAGAGGSGGTPPVCNPGETQDVGSCSQCGTKRQTCDSTGNWGPTQCVGQGTCTPGNTQSQSCDDCGEKQTRTCSNSCKWGSWSKCPGCDWNQGSHWRCCAAGSWQFCLSTCRWSSACASNSNASCCTGASSSGC